MGDLVVASSSIGRQFTVGQIVTLAYKSAGLLEAGQSPLAKDMQLGKDLLEETLDALVTEGLTVRMVELYDLQLDADTAAYTMDKRFLDLVNPASYIDASETADTVTSDGDTIIDVISREEWQRYSAKGATGRPTKVFPYRKSDAIELRFWPIPDEAGIARLQAVVELADANDENATLDLRNFWVKYIRTELAHQLAEAKSLSPSKVLRLAQKAKSELIRAKGFAHQGMRSFVRMDHHTRWR